MTDEPPADGKAAPGRRTARLVTYGLVAALSLCAVASLENWPFTSAQLFSRSRTATYRDHQVLAVLDDGSRVRIRETVNLYHTPSLSASKVDDDLCRRWLRRAGDQTGETVVGVGSYRTVSRLSRGPDGVEADVVERTLRWECRS